MEHANIQTTSPLMTFFSCLATGACILFGKLITTYQNVHLPPIIIESLQCLSYGGAFVISCITAYKFYTERKNKKHKK